MMSEVQTVRRGHLIEIILNRPEKRNAIHWPMMAAAADAVRQAESQPGVRAVLIRGEGSGFCAGIDVAAFADMASQFGEGWRENLFPLTAAFQGAVGQFERSSVPTIAVLHGFCLGLGLELALACDFRIAAEGTRLALPETRLGIIPDVGGTTRLTRLIGPARAKEYIMTGKAIDLTKAHDWGLVNAVVPAGEAVAYAEGLVAELAQAAPLAVSYAKRVIDWLADLERGLQMEAWAQAQLMQTQDFETGVQAMLTRQPPEWQGK